MALGAGCPLFPSQDPQMIDEKDPDVEDVMAPEIGERPPEVMMTAQGKAVAGVEGSYCYGPLCVDKIQPVALVAESGSGFMVVERSDIEFSIDADVERMGVSVMDESGTFIGASNIEARKNANGTFSYEIPSVAQGDLYILVFVAFQGGGDVSYIFPVTLE